MEKLQFVFNNKKLNIILPDLAAKSVWAEIFKIREYKAAEMLIADAKDAILDIGAHVGMFSMYCRVFNQTAPIFALEPEENNYKILTENIKNNDLKNIKTFQVALGEHSQKSELVISPDSINHKLSSLSTHQTKEEYNNEKHQPIQTCTLRDFLEKEKIKKVSLLKMDIEGGEYEVFSACTTYEFMKISAIIMEYHNFADRHYREIEAQLRENGFGVQIFPSKFDKKMGFIFAKNKRV